MDTDNMQMASPDFTTMEREEAIMIRQLTEAVELLLPNPRYSVDTLMKLQSWRMHVSQTSSTWKSSIESALEDTNDRPDFAQPNHALFNLFYHQGYEKIIATACVALAKCITFAACLEGSKYCTKYLNKVIAFSSQIQHLKMYPMTEATTNLKNWTSFCGSREGEYRVLYCKMRGMFFLELSQLLKTARELQQLSDDLKVLPYGKINETSTYVVDKVCQLFDGWENQTGKEEPDAQVIEAAWQLMRYKACLNEEKKAGEKIEALYNRYYNKELAGEDDEFDVDSDVERELTYEAECNTARRSPKWDTTDDREIELLESGMWKGSGYDSEC